MESRKRPHPDTEDPSVPKKRVMTDSAGSPHINGTHVEQDEPREGDNLELFRKEAIFRRMKYYSRENERCQTRIAELERRKSTCEAGMNAVATCWAQLVDSIRLLIKADYIPQVNVNSQDILDLTAHLQVETSPELRTLLEEHVAVTQSLVSKFVDLSGDAQAMQMQKDVYTECQKAKTECISLRSQMNVMRTKMDEVESQKERYHLALRAAENQAERLRSATLTAMNQAAMMRQGNKNDTQAESVKPPSPAEAQPSLNGTHDSVEGEVTQELLNVRDTRIAEVEQELSALRQKQLSMELEIQYATPEHLMTNPHYKALYKHIGNIQILVDSQREQIAKLTEELRTTQANRSEWEESHNAATNQAVQELKNMLTKRDSENARLRDQRDLAHAELSERKQLESLKNASTDEIKKMAESRGERIAVLESELRRLKTQLAANAREEELMLFFCNGKGDLLEHLQSLKDRVKEAEARTSALEDTLRLLDQNHPDIAKHMRAEAEARQTLEGVLEDLQRYRSAYGNLTSLPPDAAHLAQQLKDRDEEFQKLRLLDRQREQSEMSLYTEIDKLSAAWEALDKQLKGKILDLTAMEEKLSKGALDRAKSENKYFAAMRDKEAVESERKNLARTNEKQAKALERLVDAEKNLAAQVSSLEKEVRRSDRTIETIKLKNDELEKNLGEGVLRLESEQQRMNELYTQVREREKALEAKRQELRRTEDGLIRSKKMVEKQAAKLQAPSQSIQKDDSDDYVNHLQSLLKCSTCKVNFRNTVLTKCMHTFCKSCIDSRISTRQRKCPACNVPFGQSDAQMVYFQ